MTSKEEYIATRLNNSAILVVALLTNGMSEKDAVEKSIKILTSLEESLQLKYKRENGY